MVILETRDLRKIYGSGDTEVRALDGVDLTVEKGEFAAVVGTSGSGKSTLLHMLGGLDNPTSGKVFIDGENIASFKEEKLSKIRRRKIGFIFRLTISSPPSTYGRTSSFPSDWTANP